MPTVFLIPSSLSDETVLIPDARLIGLTHFVVENAKTARATLKKVIPGVNLSACELIVANVHTDKKQWQEIFEQIKGKDIGLLSEAGMPCIADPGHVLVLWAHEQGYKVIPLVGPNAMMMALAASGLNGQQFTFHGYLPRDAQQRTGLIKILERESSQRDRTHIFIEAPHHNQSLFIDLIDHLSPTTLVSMACCLTAADEMIATKTVAQWRKVPLPDIDKKPTVFLMYVPVKAVGKGS